MFIALRINKDKYFYLQTYFRFLIKTWLESRDFRSFEKILSAKTARAFYLKEVKKW